jgi:hypothetical protein
LTSSNGWATKVLLFNGPPRSGKDTAAIFTMNTFSYNRHVPRYPQLEIRFDRFSMPCKHAFAGAMQADSIDRFGNVYPYETTKGDVIPSLGISYRQWQIDFSEKFMKPLYGVDIFGRLFIERNRNKIARAIVVPDSGFEEEIAPVVEHFGVDEVLLLRIHRPGFDFTGDSRSYLRDGLVKNTHDVYNDSTIGDFHGKLHEIVGEFLDR